MESVCRGPILQGESRNLPIASRVDPDRAIAMCVARRLSLWPESHLIDEHARARRDGHDYIFIIYDHYPSRYVQPLRARRAAVTRAYCDAGQTTPDLIGFEVHATCCRITIGNLEG
jgi:hypothetical protein